MLGQVSHRFLRNPNYVSSIYNRVANRHDPFTNTCTVLEDPEQGRKLFLIGTTNSSTLLAQRTKELIESEKPDSVFVQTSKCWWNTIQQLQGVNTQSELNRYNSLLQTSFNLDNQVENNPRGLLFKLRLYSWLTLINWFKAFPSDFHPFIPGLEMKYAIESAQNLKKPVVLGGLAIDGPALKALETEKRMDPFSLLWNAANANQCNKHWFSEHHDNYAILDVNGGEAFAESMDRYRLCWWIKWFEKIAPYQKRVLVDQKDIDLFYAIYRNCPGKKIVAVVNQWHTPGIEAHWRHTTGTILPQQPINPVGDFDIEKFQESQLVNDTLRAIVSKTTKSEPASWKNYNTVYIKDNYEYERVRHVTYLGHDDPHMNHGLPYEFDSNMNKVHHEEHGHGQEHGKIEKH